MSVAGVRTAPRSLRPGSVWRRARRVAAAGLLTVLVAPGVSIAAPADGVGPDAPLGAAITVTTPSIPLGGTVSFTGTGFATSGRGEVLNVKIDDGAIAPATAKYPNPQVWASLTAAADGSVGGSVDLSKVHANTPLAAGTHWIRVLTGSGQAGDTVRTLHATFTIDAPAVVPADPIGPVPTAPGQSTPVATPPAVAVPKGPVWIADTAIRRTKTKQKIAVKLKAGSSGSAGTVSVKTKGRYKVGKGAKKVQTLVKSTPYFVEQLGDAKANLALTAAGKALLAKHRALSAIVTLRDANGTDTVKTEVTITR